jgi:hypothetical protein
MLPIEDGHIDPEIEQLNRDSKETLLKEAERVRTEVIGMGFEAVRLFALRDRVAFKQWEEQDSPEGPLQYYVLTDILAAPVRNNHIHTWSILLVSEHDLGESEDETPRTESLRIYIPVPENLSIFDDYDTDDLPKPDRIYFERQDATGKVTRYDLSREHLLRYTTAADQLGGEDTHEEDDFMKRILTTMAVRVDSRLPILAKIQEDMVNMKVVPQRYDLGGKAGTLDE